MTETRAPWRSLADAAGVSPERLLIALQRRWPANDRSARPYRTAHLDRAAEHNATLVAQVIEELEAERAGDDR